MIALIVVGALWAAVLLPPLLRSRAENRPNSSVSDFQDQLSSLQRVMPSRSVSVRTMGRSLAPSTLRKPVAPGRPGRSGGPVAHPRGQHSFGPSKQSTRNDSPRAARSSRMNEASIRSRTHGGRDASRARVAERPVDPATAAKRRRTNVLFALVVTVACFGFLAATTGSDGMVVLFAAAMIALGGYVYLLVTMAQQDDTGRRGFAAVRAQRDERTKALQRRTLKPVPRDPLVNGWRGGDDDYDDGYDVVDEYDDDYADSYDYADDGYDDDPYAGYEQPAVRGRRVPAAAPAARRSAQPNIPGEYGYRPAPAPQPARRDEYAADFDARPVPGTGQSGRISYGRRTAPRAETMPTPRDPRDPFGREQNGRDITRNTPLRNGRHATGQHPVQGAKQRRPSPARR